MPFSKEIFHSYDIRGTADKLSPELANAVGRALVDISGAKRVVVGRDMRETSPKLAKSLIEAVLNVGVDVVDIGMCTTSMFNFAVSHYAGHQGGVMVTASHNPAEYNGFKMSDADGLPVSGHRIYEVVSNLKAEPLVASGILTILDIREEYIDFCMKMAEIESLKSMKVVVDAGNGMAGATTLPMLFSRLSNMQVTEMYYEPDGNFPHHEANPAKEETLTDLKQQVVEGSADLGIALDGDADRVAFVDEKGQSIRGDILLPLLVKEIFKKKDAGKVIISPNASWAAFNGIKAAGGEVVLEKVGRTNIILRARREKALLGGEVSSHFFYDDFNHLESVDYTILLVLKLLSDSGQKMSELIVPYRKYFSSGENNFTVEDKDAVMEKVKEKYISQAKEVNDLDGYRLEFDHWWFNIRKSNTEPLLRLTLEADSAELMEEKLKEIQKIIEQS